MVSAPENEECELHAHTHTHTHTNKRKWEYRENVTVYAKTGHMQKKNKQYKANIYYNSL